AEHLSTLKQLPPEIVQTESLFSDNELSAAKNMLQEYLLDAGNHVETLRLLSKVEHQLDALEYAKDLLEAALKVAPDYQAAHLDYIRVLIDRQKYLQAHEQINSLLTREPGNQDYLSLDAAAYVGLGRHEPAIAIFRQLLAASPKSPEMHLRLGHS